jgi:hypothetical protein
MYKAYRGSEVFWPEGCHGVYLVMLPAGNASKPATTAKYNGFPQ